MSIYNKLGRVEERNQRQLEKDQEKILVSSNKEDEEYPNTNDTLYYNFEVFNDIQGGNVIAKPLFFDVNRIDAILKNPTDYEYGVERFSCPASIPIYIEDESEFPLKLRMALYDYNNDGTKTLKQITSEYFVRVYDNLSPNKTFNPPDINEIPNGVYSYDALVNAINIALDDATDNMKTLTGADIKEPPFLALGVDRTFTLFAPSDSLTTGGLTFDMGFSYPVLIADNNVIEIQFNQQLAKMFSGLFSWKTEDINWKTMVMKYDPDRLYDYQDVNGKDFFYNADEYDSRPEMNQFDKILFLTDNVSVKPELLGTRKDVVERQLFDYIISNRISDRTQINFFPQYVKWNNLESHIELRQFTMSVYLQYRNGKLYPLKLQPNERFNAKLVFRKKPPLNVREITNK